MRTWFHFNDSHWPLAVFEAPLRFSTVPLTRLLSDLDQCFGRREPFAFVLDLSVTSLPDSEVRGQLAEYYRQNIRLAGSLLVAEAIVVSSKPMIGLIDAIDAVASPEHPRKRFENRSDALRWTRQMLSDAGYPPPEHQMRKSGVQVTREFRRRSTSTWATTREKTG